MTLPISPKAGVWDDGTHTGLTARFEDEIQREMERLEEGRRNPLAGDPRGSSREYDSPSAAAGEKAGPAR